MSNLFYSLCVVVLCVWVCLCVWMSSFCAVYTNLVLEVLDLFVSSLWFVCCICLLMYLYRSSLFSLFVVQSFVLLYVVSCFVYHFRYMFVVFLHTYFRSLYIYIYNIYMSSGVFFFIYVVCSFISLSV